VRDTSNPTVAAAITACASLKPTSTSGSSSSTTSTTPAS
jgi:hypothetical protein